MSGDPYFSNVALLMHADGANNATAFTDSSSHAHTISGGSASAKISTTQSKFGGSSQFNDGNGNLTITSTGVADLNIVAGQDFTIEGWLFITSNASQNGTICGLDNSNNGAFNLRLSGTLRLVFEGRDTGGTSIGSITSAGALSTGAFHHVAVVRSGNTYTMYIDGVAEASVLTSATALKATSSLFNVSGDSNLGAYPSLYVDDLRFTNGTARYTSNFSVPTAAFPNNGSPLITVQPQSQSITQPATATFSVTATSSGGSLLYQWYKNNVSLGAGAQASSYTTPANTHAANDGDVYKVTVTDNNDTVTSNDATLTVGAPTNSFLQDYTDPNKPFIPLELWLVMHSIRTIPGYNKGQLRTEAHNAYTAGDTWIRRDSQTKQYYARRPKNN